MLKTRFLIILLILVFIIGCTESNGPVFKFGVITDVQYCDCETTGTRFYRSSLKKLEACVQHLNSMNDLAFTIQLGDFIDRKYESFDAVLPIYQKLEMPKYHVLGNHEFSVLDQWKDKVPGKFGLERGYYSFAIRGWRFVVLDGNDVHMKRSWEGSDLYLAAKKIHDELKSQNAPNAQVWNGALGDEQMEWLSLALRNANDAGEKIILFCHFPVYPSGMHSLWNDGDVLKLIESFDSVVAYMNGHDHNGNYALKDGIHHLNLKGMVETANENSYAIIEVYSDSLKVVGYGREPSRLLEF